MVYCLLWKIITLSKSPIHGPFSRAMISCRRVVPKFVRDSPWHVFYMFGRPLHEVPRNHHTSVEAWNTSSMIQNKTVTDWLILVDITKYPQYPYLLLSIFEEYSRASVRSGAQPSGNHVQMENGRCRVAGPQWQNDRWAVQIPLGWCSLLEVVPLGRFVIIVNHRNRSTNYYNQMG